METLSHDISFLKGNGHQFNWVEEHLIAINKDDKESGLNIRIYCTRPFGSEFWNQNPFIIAYHLVPYFMVNPVPKNKQPFYTKLSEFTSPLPRELGEDTLYIGFPTLFEALSYFKINMDYIKGLAIESAFTAS